MALMDRRLRERREGVEGDLRVVHKPAKVAHKPAGVIHEKSHADVFGAGRTGPCECGLGKNCFLDVENVLAQVAVFVDLAVNLSRSVDHRGVVPSTQEPPHLGRR